MGKLRSGSTWKIASILSIMALATAGATVEAGDQERLLSRIQELDRTVQELLLISQANAAAGTPDREMGNRVAALRLELDEIKSKALSCESEPRTLLDKVGSVQQVLGNLSLSSQGKGPVLVTPTVGGRSKVKIERRSAMQLAPPSNNDCTGAIAVTMGSTYSGDTSQATDSGSSSCGSAIDSPDVWFVFHPPSNSTYVVETFGSAFDTVLSVHSYCPGTIYNQIACNDDSYGLQSAVRFGGDSHNAYYIRVSGFNGATRPYQLSIGDGGEVTGSVLSSGDLQPAATRVEVWREDGASWGSSPVDEAGVWSVGWLTAGTYHAGTRPSTTYIEELYDDIPCPGGAPIGCEPTQGDPIAVELFVTTSGVDFVLDRGGSINGTVSDQSSGDALQGAEVTIRTADRNIGTDVTDADGQYTFTGLLPGDDYYLDADADLYQDELFDNIPCQGGPPYGCDLSSGTPVTVLLDSTTTIDFALDQRARISGQVTESGTGDPVSALLQVWNDEGNYVAHTHAYGTFSIGGLSGGTYFVTAKSSDHVTQVYNLISCEPGCEYHLSGTPVIVPELGHVESIDFVLHRRGTLQGTLTDEVTGAPIIWSDIYIYSASGSTWDVVYSDTSGQFSSAGLIAGTYFVKTKTDEYVDEVFDDIECEDGCSPLSGTPVLVTNETVTTVDFALVPFGGISGTVLSAHTGDPIDNAVVRAYNIYWEELGVDFSEADGSYLIQPLEQGTYWVVAHGAKGVTCKRFLHVARLWEGISCPGGPPYGCQTADGTPIVVTRGATTTGIDFALENAGRISGTMVYANSLGFANGTAVVLDARGGWAGSAWTVNGGGAYEVSCLPPGEYYVIADVDWWEIDEIYDGAHCQPSLWNDWHDCDIKDGTPITVTVNTTTSGIDFIIDDKGGITGTISDAIDGTPVASQDVIVYDQNGNQVRTSSSRSDGSYGLGNLHPGIYFVASNERDGDYLDELYQEIPCAGGPGPGCDVTTGTAVVVAANSITPGIDLTLDRAGTITGQLLNQVSDLPLTRYRVEVWNAAGEKVRSVDSDDSGFFSISGLTSGIYFAVTNEPTSGYLDELYDDIPCIGPPGGCDPTKGSPIFVVAGETTEAIEIALKPLSSGISGRVTNAGTKRGLMGVAVDIWSATTGTHVTTLRTNAWGAYYAELGSGFYLVSTDNSIGFFNEIWNDLRCQQGSAWDGGCDLTTGVPVEVMGTSLTTGIDFELTQIQAQIFSDGFESGGTSAWALKVP
jgi:hypothetical protein